MYSKPKLISEYIVENEIGKGGFAKVEKIRELSSGKAYAKKIYTNHLFKISEIQKEIKINKIISNFNNPYIIKYICSYIENKDEDLDEKYIIFELASKGNLFDLIKSKEMGLNDINCKTIIYKVLKALQVLHTNGICHRDIDPQNIFLDGDRYQIKLGDFGLSDFIYDENEKKILFKNEVGKPHFKAPEMFSKNNYDGEKADIYNIGVLLFVIRTCMYPFLLRRLYNYIINKEEQIYWEKISKLTKLKYRFEIEFDPQFKDLFQKLVAFNPDKRPTIEEILDHPYMYGISHANKEQFILYEDYLIQELNSRYKLL